MKLALTVILTGALAATACSRSSAEPQSAAQKPAQDTAKDAVIPPPVAVEVVAVDPAASTITVREITAVPAPPGKAVEVTLPVPASATGQNLSDTKGGEKVSVTCEVKPTVHPTAGVPVVLTDCMKVIKIDPKS